MHNQSSACSLEAFLFLQSKNWRKADWQCSIANHTQHKFPGPAYLILQCVCVCVYVFITFPNPANSCSVCKLLHHQCPALPSPTLPHLNCPEMKQSFLLLSLPKERVTKNLGEGYLNAEGEPLSSLFAFRDDYIFLYFLCKLPFVGTILILSNHFLNHLSNSASEGS